MCQRPGEAHAVWHFWEGSLKVEAILQQPAA
jgi:hypothetical protein